MKIGVIVPQGWTGEYKGWNAVDAWHRTVAVAKQSEALGFESIWLFDHFHTVPRPMLEITFEAFTALAALAAETSRVRLGHIVLCAAYRNRDRYDRLHARRSRRSGLPGAGRIRSGLDVHPARHSPWSSKSRR